MELQVMVTRSLMLHSLSDKFIYVQRDLIPGAVLGHIEILGHKISLMGQHREYQLCLS